MSHISRWRWSCRFIDTVVVKRKRQKCCFYNHPPFFSSRKVPFFILFSFTHPELSPAWPIQRGSLTCISAQHSNITAFLPSVCSAVSVQFPPPCPPCCTPLSSAARLWHTGRHFREDDGGPELWNTWELVKTLNLQPLGTVKSSACIDLHTRVGDWTANMTLMYLLMH